MQLRTRYTPIGLISLSVVDACAQVLQRIYKYGGQPFARDYLALHHGDQFDRAFGKGNGKAIMHATAGRLEATTYILYFNAY